MGIHVVKPLPHEDFYFAYSTRDGAPIHWGDARVMSSYFGYPSSDVKRADKTGSASLEEDGLDYGWACDTFTLAYGLEEMEGSLPFFVKRENMRSLCSSINERGYFAPSLDILIEIL